MQATDDKCILQRVLNTAKHNFCATSVSSSVCRRQSYHLTHAFVLSINHICKEKKCILQHQDSQKNQFPVGVQIAAVPICVEIICICSR
jgi:hypothetical protein